MNRVVSFFSRVPSTRLVACHLLLGLILWAGSAGAQDAQIERKVVELHPIPEFPPIGQLLGDWTNIPAPVFPREVQIVRSVPGEPSLTKGKKLIAVAWEHPILTLAPSANSAERFQVSLDDTSMKAVMTDLYDDWSRKLIRSIQGRRDDERRRLMAERPDSPVHPSAPVAALAVATAPTDPRMAPMVASIKSGRYPELSEATISGWHWIGKETIEGKSYETGTISYDVQTLFGKIGTRAKALMTDGQVVTWIYAGTGEPVTER